MVTHGPFEYSNHVSILKYSSYVWGKFNEWFPQWVINIVKRIFFSMSNNYPRISNNANGIIFHVANLVCLAFHISRSHLSFVEKCHEVISLFLSIFYLILLVTIRPTDHLWRWKTKKVVHNFISTKHPNQIRSKCCHIRRNRNIKVGLLHTYVLQPWVSQLPSHPIPKQRKKQLFAIVKKRGRKKLVNLYTLDEGEIFQRLSSPWNKSFSYT